MSAQCIDTDADFLYIWYLSSKSLNI